MGINNNNEVKGVRKVSSPSKMIKVDKSCALPQLSPFSPTLSMSYSNAFSDIQANLEPISASEREFDSEPDSANDILQLDGFNPFDSSILLEESSVLSLSFSNSLPVRNQASNQEMPAMKTDLFNFEDLGILKIYLLTAGYIRLQLNENKDITQVVLINLIAAKLHKKSKQKKQNSMIELGEALNSKLVFSDYTINRTDDEKIDESKKKKESFVLFAYYSMTHYFSSRWSTIHDDEEEDSVFAIEGNYEHKDEELGEIMIEIDNEIVNEIEQVNEVAVAMEQLDLDRQLGLKRELELIAYPIPVPAPVMDSELEKEKETETETETKKMNAAAKIFEPEMKMKEEKAVLEKVEPMKDLAVQPQANYDDRNGHDYGFRHGVDHGHGHDDVMFDNPFARQSVDQIIHQKLTLDELFHFGLLPRFVTAQHGSRYLQRQMTNCHELQCMDYISMIIEQLSYENCNFVQLAENIYGNYILQLFFSHGADEHHDWLLDRFGYANLLRLALSQFGCRVVQTMLCSVRSQEIKLKLVDCFRRQVERANAMQDALTQCNGNHVLQAIVESGLPFEAVSFIRDALESDLSVYAANIYSCRVVQAMIKLYGDKLDVCQLLKHGNHLRLSSDMFGNYVIQCIIKQEQQYSAYPQIKTFRAQLLLDIFDNAKNTMLLSKDKHGSNVIEASIRAATSSQLDTLIDTVCRKRGYLFGQMLRGEFSNYVPKTLLHFANAGQKERLVECLHANITSVFNPSEKYLHCIEFLRECSIIKYEMDRRLQIRERGRGPRQRMREHQQRQMPVQTRKQNRKYRSYNKYRYGNRSYD